MSNVFNLLGGGGGMKPVIRIHTSTGATVTCDGVVGTEVSGVWNFTTTIGSHTIVASMNGNTKTQTVLVDAIALYDITISLPRLPSGYQELSYIESTGTQYIDTGVLDYNDLDIVFEARSIDGGYLGARASFSLNTLYFDKWIESSVSKIGVRAGKNATKYTSEIDDSSVHTFNLTGSVFKIDDTIVSSSVSRDIDDFYNIYLFATNTAGTSIAYKQCVIYYCKLYSNNNLVRDFVPCYRKSDGEVGMYDLVSQTFFTNQGTGSFRMGAIVDDEFTSTYQQVEYLESTGTQYIDTNLLNNWTSIKIDTTFEFTSFLAGSGTGNEYALFGAKNSYSNQSPTLYGTATSSSTSPQFNSWCGSGTAASIGSLTVGENNTLSITYNANSPRTWILNGVIGERSSSYISNNANNNGQHICIFADGDNGYAYAKVKMYSFKITLNDNVARDFVPCYRKTDSVAGMYDMANRVFYENAGTGSFIVGPEV